MCEIAVMFDEGEMALIQVHADAAGVPFSEFVRRAALEKVEDMADIEAYQNRRKTPCFNYGDIRR